MPQHLLVINFLDALHPSGDPELKLSWGVGCLMFDGPRADRNGYVNLCDCCVYLSSRSQHERSPDKIDLGKIDPKLAAQQVRAYLT